MAINSAEWKTVQNCPFVRDYRHGAKYKFKHMSPVQFIVLMNSQVFVHIDFIDWNQAHEGIWSISR